MRGRSYEFRYRSSEQWLGLWREVYGPLHRALGAIDEEGQAGLSRALLDVVDARNTEDD